MTRESIYSNRYLGLVLIFGFVTMSWNLGHNTAHLDEARSILIGQKVIAGQFCYICKQYPGSVIIQPIFAAIGDYYLGIYGARAVGIFFGLGLTVTVYGITHKLFNGKYSLIAAILFMSLGTLLYLSNLATNDIVSAFFLGLAFLLILAAEKKQPFSSQGLLLLAGASSLFLSAMIKYIAAIFIPPLLLYVFLRNKFSHALLFFFFALVFFIIVYWYYAVYPVQQVLAWSIRSVFEYSQVSLRTISNWTFRWVAIPYLLSIFGLFHNEKGKTALFLIFLSLPVILLHVFTGVEQSVSKNVIFSFIFLAPVAALGVDHLGDIFSLKSTDLWVKRFFITIIVIVIGVFGIQERRWLEKQYPNMTPVIGFFKEKGFNGMTVAVDSDYAVSVYEYSLNSLYPLSHFLSVEEIDRTDEISNSIYGKVDFIIFDDYYSKHQLRDKALHYLQNNFFFIKDFKMPLSGGISHIKIFGRR